MVYHLKSSDRLKQEIKCMRFIDFHRILYTVQLLDRTVHIQAAKTAVAIANDMLKEIDKLE